VRGTPGGYNPREIDVASPQPLARVSPTEQVATPANHALQGANHLVLGPPPTRPLGPLVVANNQTTPKRDSQGRTVFGTPLDNLAMATALLDQGGSPEMIAQARILYQKAMQQ
jgi:hypothetical protein